MTKLAWGTSMPLLATPQTGLWTTVRMNRTWAKEFNINGLRGYNPNNCVRFYRGYTGIMEKTMEATI